MINRIPIIFLLALGVAFSIQAEDLIRSSKWDDALLDVEFRNVHIEADSLPSAWQAMGESCLLRSCLYCDLVSDSDSVKFVFNKQTTTGKELLEAFFSAYPAYTYTRDQETGIIWIHRRIRRYDEILGQKVAIVHAAMQVPMFTGVLVPLRRLMPKKANDLVEISDRNTEATFGNPVDLPSGVFTLRDILNFCCAQDPITGFEVFPQANGNMVIEPVNLIYRNPLAPPRDAAVKFWEVMISKPTNQVPTLDEIGLALSDPNPETRLASRLYLVATPMNYHRFDLVNKANSPKKAVWAALALRSIELARGDQPYLSLPFMGRVINIFTNDLARLDPGLALLTAMELAREKQDPNIIDVVAEHRFTTAEIAVIKPDLIRIARQSKLVRDKLSKLKFDDPTLSPENLRGLENTNLFTLVPVDKN
jgi:hypothetical protein